MTPLSVALMANRTCLFRSARPGQVGTDLLHKELYTIDKREGYKLILKDEKRNLKPSELPKADKVSNSISQANIDRTIKSKENAKNKLQIH
jgi:hypothetical protein